ncbi:RICIN domain-containing protein [Marinicella sp. S1101]|uniref:ricin-type beta-trefoil lectin domain protein n=1 Tax=Marinicella marina TaxID=2996016 RepID=UPI002260C089|nr:RICIN domain-containing protein [Marinicella marina]MCX7554014.1 RICIN domain-containing protein [Marinicella marina]MDJ1140506.1 RICIN domain-containing protein [Marinicella marina]
MKIKRAIKPSILKSLTGFLFVFNSVISFSHAEVIIKLKNQSVERCLNVHAGNENRHGGAVSVYSCTTTNDQNWAVIEIEDDWIQLKNISTRRCLNIHKGRENKEGGKVSIANCANTPDQFWQVVKNNDHSVQLKNKSTNRCLNIHRGRHNFEGAPVTSYTCNGSSNDQSWQLTNLSNDIGSTSARLTGGINDINSRQRNATVRLERTNGNLACSAVLISPTIILSAGHCWDPSPRPRPVGSAAPFSLNDWETPGDWYNFPATANLVARIGSNDSLAGTTYAISQYNITGNTDIIMFRLADPVPNSEAIPADVITTNGPTIN